MVAKLYCGAPNVTNMMLDTIFVKATDAFILFKTIFSHHSLGVRIAHLTIVDVNLRIPWPTMDYLSLAYSVSDYLRSL